MTADAPERPASTAASGAAAAAGPAPPVAAAGPPAEERAAWLQLTLTAGVGPAAQRALLAAFGLPAAVLAAPAREQARVAGEDAARALRAGADAAQRAAQQAEAWLAGAATRSLLTLADSDYPRGLLALADPPALLYLEGRRELLRWPALAIVGSRSGTVQGCATAQAFARHLARAGLAIVSGMALGIDAAAHRGALGVAADLGAAGPSSIGLVGTGVDVDYPPRHRDLAAAMRASGLLISELPLGSPALAHHFPRRNRLIAGLSQGVLVVEAAVQSGSLITARLAAELGREVFAIPGSIHSPLARGCHQLIRSGAKLVETARDVLEELGPLAAAPPGAHAPAAPDPDPEARISATTPTGPAARLLEVLGHDPLPFELLVARLEAPVGEVSALLLALEFDGLVERLPGNLVRRLHR